MFTHKKDEEIAELKATVESLNSRLKSEETMRIDLGVKADREYAEHKSFENDSLLKEEKLNSEIARLRRIVTSEKKKRINSACANRRRLHGRSKMN
jgi:hypothetical protein